MEVALKRTNNVIEISLSNLELELLIGGIGATSIHSRKEAGMTSEQAYCVDSLYYALATALRNSEDYPYG